MQCPNTRSTPVYSEDHWAASATAGFSVKTQTELQLPVINCCQYTHDHKVQPAPYKGHTEKEPQYVRMCPHTVHTYTSSRTLLYYCQTGTHTHALSYVRTSPVHVCTLSVLTPPLHASCIRTSQMINHLQLVPSRYDGYFDSRQFVLHSRSAALT